MGQTAEGVPGVQDIQDMKNMQDIQDTKNMQDIQDIEGSSAEDKALIMRVSRVSIVVNLALSVLKLFAGLIAHSGAMISDAVHSASDIFSTIIVMIGVNIAGRKSDAGHQYGHERMESVAAILLAGVLFATGLGIGYTGMKNIVSGDYTHLAIPGVLALAAAIVSIVVKEWMYWFSRAAAKKVGSAALMADAWHHRSDALSSVGALIGIFGARIGFPVMDSVASVVICIFIIKASVDIFRDAIDRLVDKSCDQELVYAMKKTIFSEDGVIDVDDIRTRLFGNKIYVDIEIAADGDQKLWEAHAIAERVHHKMEREFPSVKHCTVHVNPR